MGIGAAMAGGNPQDERQSRDFYPTPVEVTQALMDAEAFEGSIHECACGDGQMARVMETFGYTVIGTDIHPLGYGAEADFFAITEPMADNIVTNPPFDLAARFITHGLEVLRPRKMALMLKSTYWHAARRHALWQQFTPSVVYPLLWRPDFLNKGAPTMEVSWCVWDRDHKGATMYCPLPKPGAKKRLHESKDSC